jgi:hypothetical protein
MTRVRALLMSLTTAAALAGCGVTDIPGAVDTPLETVTQIVADTGLTSQEKREELRDLGFSDVLINGLLDADRLGNQFGGDLESARDKVIAETIDTMTPDEIQAYGDAIGPQFTDPVAQILSDTFRDEALNSQDAIEAWLDDPVNELPSSVNVDDVRTVFVDSDPDDVIDDL